MKLYYLPLVQQSKRGTLGNITELRQFTQKSVIHQHLIKPVLKQLYYWLPVNQRINYKILLLTYKALNGQPPGYITELLKPYAPTRNLRSSSKNLLNVPTCQVCELWPKVLLFCSTQSMELSS